MAASYKTLAELVILNDPRNGPVNVSDILNDSPFLRTVAADTTPETTYKYSKYSTAPTVGFRDVNDGRENSKSSDTQVSVDLKLLDLSFDIDKALADNYNKGGASALLSLEAMRHIQAGFFLAERQFFYGTVSPGNSSGFSGLGNETDLNGASDAQVINAGGTTSATGSSVWAVRLGNDDCKMILGYSGQIQVGDPCVIQRAGSSTGTLPAYYVPQHAYMGIQRGSTYSAARLANLTAETGKGCTDAQIAKLLELFPASRMPTHLVMNRRSLRQLQSSRTATNSSGTPAPFPTEAFGFPIIVTDAIVSTETILS